MKIKIMFIQSCKQCIFYYKPKKSCNHVNTFGMKVSEKEIPDFCTLYDFNSSFINFPLTSEKEGDK